MTLVLKRDGTTQEFDGSKITRAIQMAADSVGVKDFNAESSEEAVLHLLRENGKLNSVLDIEDIQDAVERVLMRQAPEIAKHYVLYRAEHAQARAMSAGLIPDPMELARYIHPAKYGRYLPDKQRRETYPETVERVFQMHRERFPNLAEELALAERHVLEQRCLPSMRSMQFGGASCLQHNAQMYNCSFTLIDRAEVFGEVLYLLLCGCGVGYSVQWEHVNQLPPIGVVDRHKVEHNIIPDTIEGWADSVNALFQSYLDGVYLEMSYANIRREGAPLRTSGGRAPGHLPLKELHKNMRRILDGAQGRQLRPIEAYDMLCHLADCVLSGGIRRSSTIAIFSPNDPEMLYSKHPWSFEHDGKNAQRAMSNNSARLDRKTVTQDEFDRIMKTSRDNPNGEPGFVFTDHIDFGTNPCGEIGLYPVEYIEPEDEAHEDRLRSEGWVDRDIYPHGLVRTGFAFCNLCEINGASLKGEDEFYSVCEAAAILGTVQASYTDFRYLGPASKRIAERDALLGVSICGIQDNPGLLLDPFVLREGADIVQRVNARIADILGIGHALRSTCVKPGGTAPLELGGVASGIGCHHARRYFRRVTANPNEPVAQWFKKHNPHAVEQKPNGDWALVFPIHAPTGAKTVKNSDAMNQIGDIFRVYENWILYGERDPSPYNWLYEMEELHHNVSCTVTFRPEEWELLQNTVWENRELVTAMAFLPLMSDKGIPFMPREEVVTRADEAYWSDLITNWRSVDYSKMVESEDGTMHTMEVACGVQGCELQ